MVAARQDVGNTLENNKMESKTTTKETRAWMELIAARAMARVRYAVAVMRCWMFPDQQPTEEDRDVAACGQEHGITPAFIKSVFFCEGGWLEGEMPHVGLDYLEANGDDITPWMERLDDECSDGNTHWAAALDEVLTKAVDAKLLDGDTLEEFVHITETRYFREAEKLYKDRMFAVLAEYDDAVNDEWRLHKQVCDWLARQLDWSDFLEIVTVYELDRGFEAEEDERFEDEDAYNNAMYERATEWVADCLCGDRGNEVFGTWDECATVLIKYCSDDQVRYVWDVLEMEQYEWL